MKIIQTFWPEEVKQGGVFATSSGWIEAGHYWMSWALSCLQLRQYYDNVHLVTNDLGKEILINKLQLPYSSSSVELNNEVFTRLPRELWAMSKVFSYGLQDEPFLHVDGDVFIYEKFNQELFKQELVVQSLEINLEPYHNGINIIKKYFNFLPQWILNDLKINKNRIISCNAGIMGGKNISFFKEYSTTVFEFVLENETELYRLKNDKCFNAILEQFLFSALSRKEKIPLTSILEPVKSFKDFDVVADILNIKANKFIHLLGHFKKYAYYGDFVARKLCYSYPDHYYRILKYLKVSNVRTSYPIYSTKDLDISELSASDFLDLKLTYKHKELSKRETSFRKLAANFEECFSKTAFLLNTFAIDSIKTTVWQLSEMANKKSIIDLKNIILSIPKGRERAMCLDVFRFEYARFKLLKGLKDDKFLYALFQLMENTIEEFLMLEPEVLLDKVLIEHIQI